MDTRAVNEQSVSAADESVLRRIKKLLDRAERDVKSPLEAGIAAEQAARLMSKYRLDRAVVEAATGERQSETIDVEVIFALPVKVIPQWFSDLASHVLDVSNCKHYYTRVLVAVDGKRAVHRAVKAVGRLSDRQAAKVLLEFLAGEIDRLAAAALADRKCSCGSRARGARCSKCGDPLASARTYGNNFRIGAAETVGERLRRAAQQSRDATSAPESDAAAGKLDPEVVSQALVLLSRDRHEVDLYYRDLSAEVGLRNIRSRSATPMLSAREAGREAGRRIHLGPQIQQGAAPRALLDDDDRAPPPEQTGGRTVRLPPGAE